MKEERDRSNAMTAGVMWTILAILSLWLESDAMFIGWVIIGQLWFMVVSLKKDG